MQIIFFLLVLASCMAYVTALVTNCTQPPDFQSFCTTVNTGQNSALNGTSCGCTNYCGLSPDTYNLLIDCIINATTTQKIQGNK